MTTAARENPAGRIVRINGPLVEVEDIGLVAMQEVIELGELRIPAEVLKIDGNVVTAQAYEYLGGMCVGDRAAGTGRPLSAPLGPALLGGIFDGLLRPLGGAAEFLTPGALGAHSAPGPFAFTPEKKVGDAAAGGMRIGVLAATGGVEHRVLVPPGDFASDGVIARIGDRDIALTELWPVRIPRPLGARRAAAAPLLTGQRALDLFYPIAKGDTAGVPGGFGTGKTMMLQQILKWSDADVIIFVGCGERGNELADAMADLAALKDPKTGRALLERTVVIANTSNMPVMAREASIYSGMTVAEYYRDMGYDALVIADSTSRWAEALREFSARAGELPAEEGFPARLASAIAAFYERAGRVTTLGGSTASVTAMGAVSPPGGDMTDRRGVARRERAARMDPRSRARGWHPFRCRPAGVGRRADRLSRTSRARKDGVARRALDARRRPSAKCARQERCELRAGQTIGPARARARALRCVSRAGRCGPSGR